MPDAQARREARAEAAPTQGRRSRSQAAEDRRRRPDQPLQAADAAGRPCPRSSRSTSRRSAATPTTTSTSSTSDRVWKAWTAAGDFAGLGGAWTLAGQLDSGGKFRFELTDADGVARSCPAREIEVDRRRRARLVAAARRSSGGLLPALHLWRRLAVEGPEQFGEVYYLGTAPLAGPRRAWSTCWSASHNGVECRFYFDPDRRPPAGPGDVPRRRRRSRARSTSPTTARSTAAGCPRRMEVRYGDEPFAVFKLERVQVREARTRCK